MKVKSVLFLVLIVMANVDAKSQDFYFGLRIGYGQASLKSEGTPTNDLSSRSSPNIAAVFNNRFANSSFGFSFEPGYILKGSRIDNDALDYRFNYLNIPLLLDLYVSEKVKLSIGPEFSYLLTSKNRLNDSTKVKFQNLYDKNWEVSGTVGISFALDYFAEFGARYNTSFTKERRLDPVLDTRNLYNQYFQIFFLLKIAN